MNVGFINYVVKYKICIRFKITFVIFFNKYSEKIKESDCLLPLAPYDLFTRLVFIKTDRETFDISMAC